MIITRYRTSEKPHLLSHIMPGKLNIRLKDLERKTRQGLPLNFTTITIILGSDET